MMKCTIIVLTVFVFISSILCLEGLPSYFHPTDYYSQVAKNVMIKDCSDNKFPLRIKEVKISPDIVVAGGKLTIEAIGELDRTVYPGASADVLVKLGAVRLLHKKFDLCKELDNNKDDVELQCPIEEGLVTVTQDITLPKEVPRARFVVDVHAFYDDEVPLACLQVIADFRVRKFQAPRLFLMD